uniref:Uncharacterized protein n=1 Tax=Musa acuminata subsp. malaccensis TaxID=214687 RepID=A0A804I1T5_MUSAM
MARWLRYQISFFLLDCCC